MVKRLLSIAAVLALFSTVALAQEGPVSGTVKGSDTVTTQAGPGMRGPGPMTLRGGPGGPMQGPRVRTFEMRMRGPMGRGPGMGFHRHGMGSWWRNPAIAERIGLNDQQKEQLEKISQSSRLKMIDLRADLEKQQVILGPMLQAFRPDEAQVLAQVEKVSQARAAVEKARIQTMLATRNVLTEEQWTKLKDRGMGFHHAFRQRGFQRGMRRGASPTPPSK